MKKSCGFLIECDGKFLMCHSSNPNGKVSLEDGQWGIPKGGCEDNETELEAAIRETAEETGIDVTQYPFSKTPLIKYSTKTKKYIIFYAKIHDSSMLSRDLDCSTYIADGSRKENDDFVWVDWKKANEIAIKNQRFNLFVSDVKQKIKNIDTV